MGRIKNLFYFLIVFFLSTDGFCQNYAPEIESIFFKKKKMIVALVEFDQPPFSMRIKEGKWLGSDIELVEDIAEKWAVPIEYVTAPTYDDVINLVFQHKADLGINISRDLTRAKKVVFTDPYIILHMSLLVNRKLKEKMNLPNRSLVSALNQGSVKIGSLIGSSYEKKFVDRLFPKAQIVSYKTVDEICEGVKEGEVVAGMIDEVKMKRYSKNNPEAMLQVQSVLIEDEKEALCIALPWDYRHFQYWLDLYVSLRETISIDAILEKYER